MLEAEIDVLNGTPEGSRNGQLIAGGELAESAARAALEEASSGSA